MKYLGGGGALISAAETKRDGEGKKNMKQNDGAVVREIVKAKPV